MDLEIEIEHRTLALDKRSRDSDGRMQVTDCVLTRANVCPYVGREIPDETGALRLDPDRIYQLYRDPASLKSSLPSLNGKPLLLEHSLTSAADPKQWLTVGTVGECRWEAPDAVVGTIWLWSEDAIRAVETGALKDLSCGYRYGAVMTPGVAPDGTPFDGRMIVSEFNHIALVEIGRVAGAMVGDSARTSVSPLERLIPHYGRLR